MLNLLKEGAGLDENCSEGEKLSFHRKFITVRGFTLVEIMIVVAIIALLASLAIPNLLRANRTARETEALAVVKAIGNAIELYNAQTGVFPGNITSLTSASPPYLSADYAAYCGNLTVGTYEYACTFFDDGFDVEVHFTLGDGISSYLGTQCSDGFAIIEGAEIHCYDPDAPDD